MLVAVRDHKVSLEKVKCWQTRMEITYKESGNGRYTEYRLQIDKIEIKNGEILGRSSFVEYPLNELRPNQSKVLQRDYSLNPVQYALSFFGIVGLLFLCVTYEVNIWGIFVALALYAGLISGLVFMRPKIEYTVFLLLDHSPLFAIGKRGKRKNEYESFIEELVERIHFANQATEAIGTSSASRDSSS